MKNLGVVVLGLVFCMLVQGRAQETDLKKIYTDITTSINSALLTRKGAYEVNGFLFYDRLKVKYKDSYNFDGDGINETYQAETGIAYFLINNLSGGLLFSYLHQKQYRQPKLEQTMIGPVIKKYFGEEEWRPYLFTDYLFCTGDILDGGEWDAGIGLLYHVAGNFGVTLQVKYGNIFSRDSNIKAMNRVVVGLGIVNFIL
jgi:hypothetical protein